MTRFFQTQHEKLSTTISVRGELNVTRLSTDRGVGYQIHQEMINSVHSHGVPSLPHYAPRHRLWV